MIQSRRNADPVQRSWVRGVLIVAAAVAALTFAPTSGPATAGLVAAFSFDEGSGSTVTDLSGTGNTGTISNATWTTAGKYGKALIFNGTNARVNVPDAASLHLTSAMTLEAWVNPSVVTRAWRDVIYKGNDNYYLEGTSTRNPGVPVGGGTFGSATSEVNGSSALTANTWTHLAVTYGGGALRLYVNGTQVASRSRTGNLTTSTNPLTIGSDPIYGQYFSGTIDEIRIYNTTLSAAQIQSDMGTPVSGSPADTQLPTAPTNLTATASGSAQVNLSWTASTDNVGVTGYRVERCQGAGCSNFAQIATPAGTSFSDTGLSSSTSYSYRVRATDAAGNLSGYSSTASATTQAAADTQLPTAPTNLTATASGSAQVNLSWTASTDNVGVTGYRVERCQGAGCSNFAQIATPAGTSFSDTGLSSSTSYSYRVRATDAAGNLSGYSSTASATTQAAVASGLVVSYGFEEGSGTTIADASGNGNIGTLSNATWTAAGKYGKALNFNGTSSRVTIPDAASLHLTSAMTLEAWVNPTTVNSNWRDVIEKGDDNYFLMATSDSSSRPVGGGTIGGSFGPAYGTAALATNTWAHLAVSYGGGAVRLYLNGTQVSSVAKTGSILISTSPLTIGSDPIYGQYFSGTIDEIRIYNTTLSAAQIQSDMGTPVSGSPADTQLPTAPTNLTATASGSAQVNLSWTASTDNVGVTGYRVERCQGAGCSNFAQIATPAGTSFSDTGLSSSTSYSYRVRATDAAGNLSGYSSTASATTQSAPNTYSIGGTVSGLSGTVVLQNNGGSDLSVASNGPFTFSTPLADGAAYSVTVKTNPSGQTCTVSSASGTVASANVTNVAVACSDTSATPGADDFNRANGGLGPNWADLSDGGLSISTQVVLGSGGGYAGDIRTGETYASDQYSQVEVTSTQLTGSQWIGPAVRAQNGGQNTYLGIYFWNNGTPILRLYKRSAGNWIQLGASYNSGPLAAGTKLKLIAVGSRISFLQDGVERIAVSDGSFTGGAPGIIAYGTATADNWSAGTATTYSIGGTVSGLSGTVVLQNNGGSDLSVASNGPFTFSTPLADGAAYSVTVKTNPSGQTCTVSSASGTVASANVTNVAVACSDTSATPGADDFNRANGGLGPNWADLSDGGLSISTQVVLGSGGGYAGDIRTGETYASDQYSQVEVTSTQLTGSQWIGPAVRAQNGGQNTYLGIYFWNNGTPILRLYKRSAGNWIQLGASYNSGPLAAGTKLKLIAVGSRISFLQDGVERIAVSDGSFTGGAPGIIAYGTATADNWSAGTATTYSIGGTVSGLSGTVVLQNNGGSDLSVASNGPFTFSTPLADGAAYSVTVKTNPSGQTCTVSSASGTVASANVTNVAVACSTSSSTGFQIVYRSTDANGVVSYDVTSANNGYGTHVLRVLAPHDPAPGVPHNFLYVLPVEAELGTQYGDGLETMRALDAQDQYNLTIIEPSFEIEPWYADNPNDSNLHYETFMTDDLLPWVTQNLALTSHEQNWLIGFSKSGIGGTDLILKHPNLFTLAASWDFPADMSAYDQFGSSSANCYGTNANFQVNYRLTPAFVDAHKTPFLSDNRIWIGGYSASANFQDDMSNYDALLTSDGIAHTTETPQPMLHRWDSGWVSIALAALREDSSNLPAT